MLQQYIGQPEVVEVHKVGKNTDIILRQNITRVTRIDDESGGFYEVWECEEKQLRYGGSVTAKEVKADFDSWWEYADGSTITIEDEIALTQEQRITALETEVDDLNTVLDEVLISMLEG